jgi:hypothetical protein
LRWRFRFNSPRRTISFEFGLDPNEAGQKQRKGAAATIERKGTEPINVVILRVKTNVGKLLLSIQPANSLVKDSTECSFKHVLVALACVLAHSA